MPADGGPDIFTTIAANALVRGGMPDGDPQTVSWIAHLADEMRTAMGQLDVQVKPKGPAPDPTRTRNGVCMLLLAGLENGDLWIADALVPVRVDPVTQLPRYTPTPTITFDIVGVCQIQVEYIRSQDGRRPAELQYSQLAAIMLPNGVRISADHTDHRWMLVYRPPVHTDVFGPALNVALSKLDPADPVRATTLDGDGRTWGWDHRGAPELLRDARGRVWR